MRDTTNPTYRLCYILVKSPLLNRTRSNPIRTQIPRFDSHNPRCCARYSLRAGFAAHSLGARRSGSAAGQMRGVLRGQSGVQQRKHVVQHLLCLSACLRLHQLALDFVGACDLARNL